MRARSSESEGDSPRVSRKTVRTGRAGRKAPWPIAIYSEHGRVERRVPHRVVKRVKAKNAPAFRT